MNIIYYNKGILNCAPNLNILMSFVLLN